MTHPKISRPAGVQISGTGMCVPEKLVTNDDLSKIVDTNDQWIRQRTGIATRYIAAEHQRASDFAIDAVIQALENANLKPSDLDLLICATMTQDMICPATACKVVDKIGAIPCGAMDINMACTGMVAGLSMAANCVSTGMYRNVAVVGADTLSRIMDWEDRGTCILFGDAAGAAIVSPTDNPDQGCIYQQLESDGSMGHALYVPRDEHDLIDKPGAPEFTGKFNTLQMNGREVFKFAVKTMTKCVKEALETTDLTADDIKMVIPHQSNIRILQSAWKKLGFGDEKVYVNIDRFGNTSAASVGLCLHELTEQGKLQQGDLVVFVAQGGGLTWGTSVWKL